MGVRLRRHTGNWMEAGHEYDIIALQESRQEDAASYPIHKAHLWSKHIGVQDLNLQVAAGIFSGVDPTTNKNKVFRKTIAQVNVFGQSASAMDIEVSRSQSAYDEIQRVVFVAVGGYVVMNSQTFSDEEPIPTLYNRIPNKFDWELFVSGATVNIQIALYVQISDIFEILADFDPEQTSYTVESVLSPPLTVRGFINFQFIV